MTFSEEINAKCSAELLASGDHAAIAARVSDGRIKTVETRIGYGAVMSDDGLGPDAGAALLDRMELMGQDVSPVKWAMVLLANDKLNIADAGARRKLDVLVQAKVMTDDQAARLKALADVPDPVTPAQVADALRDPDAWQEQFTPRRPGETVGTLTVTRRGFTFTSTLNQDIQETVDAYWAECLAAEARVA